MTQFVEQKVARQPKGVGARVGEGREGTAVLARRVDGHEGEVLGPVLLSSLPPTPSLPRTEGLRPQKKNL